MPLHSSPAAGLIVLISVMACQFQTGAGARVYLPNSLPQFPLRSVTGEPCTVADQWLVVDYKDGEDTDKAGTFVHGTIASWNGLLLATKTHDHGQCIVSYRVVCEGSSIILALYDTCGSRTDRRPFYLSSRRTLLHKYPFFRHFGDADVALRVFLAGAGELEMLAEHSEVTFTLVDPDKETGKLYGAAEFRYFVNSPRLDVCKADDDSDQFVSKGTGYAYSTQTCSSCRLFLAGALQNDPSNIHAALATPNALCVYGVSTRSRTACENFVSKLVKEDPSFGTKITDSWAGKGTAMSAELASSMACQDIGCCPVDPELAETFDDMMRVQSEHEQYFERVAKLEWATKILDDPVTRQKLELNLANKVFNRKEGHVERPEDGSSLPTTDEECAWNYRDVTCANPGVCSYQYKFLDVTFDESCRLRVRPLRPLSDADCTWSAKHVACADQQFCKRSCKFGESLNQCCKLKELPPTATEIVSLPETVDVKPEPEGICGNTHDRQILSSSTLADDLEKIGRKCFSVFTFSINAEKSLKLHVAYGLSPPCAVCFVDVSVCGMNECFGVLSTKGKDHPDSKACMKEHCNDAMEACTGLPESERSR